MTHEDFKARMEQLNNEVLEYSEVLAREFEKEIDRAILTLEKDLEYWFARLAKNNQISLAEARKLLRGKALKEFQWTVEEYIRHGEENGISADWRKELENASARIHISWIESAEIQLKNLAEMLREESQQTATQAMTKVYEEGYWRTAFEMEKALKIGVDLPRVDTEIIKQKILHPWTADGDSYMKRITTNTVKLEQRVNTELTQMLMRGDPPRKAIDTIAEEFHVAKRHAARLIMTESAAMASLASKEVYKDLNVERYEILVTLDEITCPKCRPLDGKIFDRTAYRVGVTANPFHPSCRCTTVPYYDDFNEGSMRAARDEDGKSFELPANIKYEEFRKMMEERQENRLKIKEISDRINKNIPQTWNREKKSQLGKAIIDLLKDVFNDGKEVEHAATYTMDMQLIRKFSGNKQEVNVSRPNKDYILIHNHPDNRTFSENDIVSFINSGKLITMFAIGNNGSVYMLKKKENYNAAEFIENFLKEENNIQEAKTPEEYHNAMESFLKGAEKYGIEYFKGNT